MIVKTRASFPLFGVGLAPFALNGIAMVVLVVLEALGDRAA